MNDRTATKFLVICLATIMAGHHGSAAPLQDPTRPYQYDSMVQVSNFSTEQIDWNLSGIKITDAVRSATLNGKLVKEGDEIDSATVLEIKPAEVIILYDHRRIVVRLLISGIKRPIPGNAGNDK